MRVDYRDLEDIYEREVKKNTKNKRAIYSFDRFKVEYLTEICKSLENGTYKFSKYNIFLIKKPKYRVVMSMSIKDKIVNHYITRHILMPKLEGRLDFRNVATRKELGRDYGLKLVKKYIEYYKTKDSCYVLKMDISKYFYTIDHEVILSMVKPYLSDEEYELVEDTIKSTDLPYINETIEKLVKREKNLSMDAIAMYDKGKGLPIGNMSSQFLSIFYLSGIDHMIIPNMKITHYVRYMDDFLLFAHDKEYLNNVKKRLIDELNGLLHLKVNEKKTLITNLRYGFTFCGYRFRVINNKTIMTACSDTRTRVKKRLKELAYLYKKGLVSESLVFCSINTYMHGFKFGSQGRMRRLVDKYFWDRL